MATGVYWFTPAKWPGTGHAKPKDKIVDKKNKEPEASKDSNC